ncbi:isopenicillin N synthase family oxygenase [Waterburya agarophytonicola K14]|uniref:Isopenicillin N synthase family oxygenase n=1 Tax=Waterburya agarophytonicola KI4 TaxID=2874699 RepID=A0A964FFX3_9CYAN|nr:2-oxoglutarate and iron-dependent oxygenase domain-containing protein [Waterburya agarophytonicola]MCC0178330.1 isopenicillin N synthase family oxygenase [Waterburya agarophytonicola KI4]
MKDILYNEIPSVDLSDFVSHNPKRKHNFVQNIGQAYQNIGFVAVKNHGLSDDLTANLYSAVKQFFALPEATKLNYEINNLGGQRGYTARGKEHAKGRSVGDLKEFYHVGQELSPTERSLLEYPGNIFPQEVPEFATATVEAFRTLEATGMQILRAIALYLGLDEFFFDNKVNKGNSILRAIHYFPLDNPQDIPDGAVRAAAHGDINLITLLMGASAEGLQILRQDGAWIPVTALQDKIVVNVGDMLERLTNKKLKSTVHRVINPSKELLGTPRYSIPFFMHPISEMDLTCLPSCIDEENPKQFEDITAGEFLSLRLREIGLIK